MNDIDRLVYTSADDLRVQLRYYKDCVSMPALEILQGAYALCLQHGYKTKANLLTRAINKIAKEAAK